MGWAPGAVYNQDVVFEIGLQWQRKDGEWLTPVACAHTVRKTRGFVRNSSARVLVITNAHTREADIDVIANAASVYGLGADLMFWNVDHPQGHHFEDVLPATSVEGMVFEMRGAAASRGKFPNNEQVNCAIAQRRMHYWQAPDAPVSHTLDGIEAYIKKSSDAGRPLGLKALDEALTTTPLRLEPFSKMTIDVERGVSTCILLAGYSTPCLLLSHVHLRRALSNRQLRHPTANSGLELVQPQEVIVGPYHAQNGAAARGLLQQAPHSRPGGLHLREGHPEVEEVF